MVADDLAMQGAKASVTMIMTSLSGITWALIQYKDVMLPV